jgi:hypothetical protein
VGAEGDDQVAAQPKVVTAADVVAGHVRLDICCLDRLCLNGCVARLPASGGVVWFFPGHRGKPIVSPALFEPIGQKFRREVGDWAQANGVPLIRFAAGERKAEVMARYLEAAAAAGRSRVVAIGCAQEFPLVWAARQRDTGPGRPPPFFSPGNSGGCPVFYVYIFGTQMGPGFIKVCTCFPYPVQVWNQWARVGQAAGGHCRDRVHRAAQRVRLLRRPGCPAADLRPVRPGHRAGVVRAVDGQAPAAAHRG